LPLEAPGMIAAASSGGYCLDGGSARTLALSRVSLAARTPFRAGCALADRRLDRRGADAGPIGTDGRGRGAPFPPGAAFGDHGRPLARSRKKSGVASVEAELGRSWSRGTACS